MSDYAIIKNLHYRYDDNVIFSGVYINIPRGKITAIMGPSGTGKTTLLRIIGGELKPDDGTVEINNTDIHTLSRKNLYSLRRDMGLLFQSGALFTNLTVYENIAFPLREHTNLSEALIRNIVLMKLQLVGLRGARNLRPNQLSGGMARRVALARALALDPQLIMYDEPFTALDPISLGMIAKLIREINHALGMTAILVSHDVAETMAIADTIYVISGGKIIGQGTPAELAENQTPAVKQFIQGLPDGVVPFHYPANEYKKDLLTNA